MVFVTAGMGGGTGTGAAPGHRADRARVRRAHRRRRHQAVRLRRHASARGRPTRASRALRRAVDTLITIPNKRLLALVGAADVDARRVPQGRRGAAQRRAGHQRPHHRPRPHQRRLRRRAHDHEASMGRALMGTGIAHAASAARSRRPQRRSARRCSRTSRIDGATGILINITGGPDLTLHEVNEASTLIQEAAHEDANIIFGSVIDAEPRRRGAHHRHRDRLRSRRSRTSKIRCAHAPVERKRATQIAMPYTGIPTAARPHVPPTQAPPRHDQQVEMKAQQAMREHGAAPRSDAGDRAGARRRPSAVARRARRRRRSTRACRRRSPAPKRPSSTSPRSCAIRCAP